MILVCSDAPIRSQRSSSRCGRVVIFVFAKGCGSKKVNMDQTRWICADPCFINDDDRYINDSDILKIDRMKNSQYLTTRSAATQSSFVLSMCRGRLPKNVYASAMGLCKDSSITQSRKQSKSDFLPRLQHVIDPTAVRAISNKNLIVSPIDLRPAVLNQFLERHSVKMTRQFDRAMDVPSSGAAAFFQYGKDVKAFAVEFDSISIHGAI